MTDRQWEPDLGRYVDRVLTERGRGAAADLARKSGLDEPWISNVRHGRRVEMTWERFTRLAHGLGMTRAQLLAAVDDQPLPPDVDRVEFEINRSPRLLPSDRATVLAVYQRLRVDRQRGRR